MALAELLRNEREDIGLQTRDALACLPKKYCISPYSEPQNFTGVIIRSAI